MSPAGVALLLRIMPDKVAVAVVDPPGPMGVFTVRVVPLRSTLLLKPVSWVVPPVSNTRAEGLKYWLPQITS